MHSSSHKYGLRTVAVLEALKAAAVIALCCVLLSLLHKDLDSMVDRLVDWLRLNPDSRVADWFYEVADRTTGHGIWTAVTVGFVYSTGRLVEAYGLWRERAWAEWFAVISGAVYVPFEVYTLIAHPHWSKVVVLAINLLIVFYVFRILMETRRGRFEEQALRQREASARNSEA